MAEIHPTPIRQRVTAFLGVFGTIGSVSVPFLKILVPGINYYASFTILLIAPLVFILPPGNETQCSFLQMIAYFNLISSQFRLSENLRFSKTIFWFYISKIFDNCFLGSSVPFLAFVLASAGDTLNSCDKLLWSHFRILLYNNFFSWDYFRPISWIMMRFFSQF